MRFIRDLQLTCAQFSHAESGSISLQYSHFRSKWETGRANQSKRHTATASKRRRWASDISLLSSGLLSFAPEIPASTYSSVTFHFLRSQYSRRSRGRMDGSWPLFVVETRECPILRQLEFPRDIRRRFPTSQLNRCFSV
jgi:hypothetical protein